MAAELFDYGGAVDYRVMGAFYPGSGVPYGFYINDLGRFAPDLTRSQIVDTVDQAVLDAAVMGEHLRPVDLVVVSTGRRRGRLEEVPSLYNPRNYVYAVNPDPDKSTYVPGGRATVVFRNGAVLNLTAPPGEIRVRTGVDGRATGRPEIVRRPVR